MLSPEQFGDLIHLIETSQDDGPKPEVRRAQRITHPCRLTITLGNNAHSGPNLVVQLKDISARGVCLLHTGDLSIGAHFVVKLANPKGNTNVAILCQVVYCRRVDKDVFQVGAEFVCVLNKKEPTDDAADAANQSRIRDSILN